MARTLVDGPRGIRARGGGPRRRASAWLGVAIESVVLALVVASPWAFGAVEPEHELVVDAGVAALAMLWGARMLAEGRLRWRPCPVASCLAALALLGAWQATPLGRPWLARLAPATARLYDRLLPATPEAIAAPAHEGAAPAGPAAGT